VPEENFWILWCKGRLTEADTLTIRLGATPSGLTSAYLTTPLPIIYDISKKNVIMEVQDSRVINRTVARYDHILTFTKLATYSASVVIWQCWGINPSIPP